MTTTGKRETPGCNQGSPVFFMTRNGQKRVIFRDVNHTYVYFSVIWVSSYSALDLKGNWQYIEESKELLYCIW